MSSVGQLNGNTAPVSDSPAHRRILEVLISSSRALTALLVSKQGIVLASAGETDQLNITAVAALVAGMFTATREVARLVGENQFSVLLQQGEMRHIHISLVTGDAMMLVIFEDQNRTGLVRHCAKKAAEQLEDVSRQNAGMMTNGDPLSLPKFKEYALDLIDRIFGPQPE